MGWKRNQASARTQATILLHGTRSLIFHTLCTALVEGVDLPSPGSEARAGVKCNDWLDIDSLANNHWVEGEHWAREAKIRNLVQKARSPATRLWPRWEVTG